MTTPNKGDRVHVAFDALYHGPADGRHVVKIPNAMGWVLALPADAEVEVLRPRVKVGDVIETTEELDALPLWSVVRESGDDLFSVFRRFTGDWYADIASDEPATPRLPATVLYLPDAEVAPQ